MYPVDTAYFQGLIKHRTQSTQRQGTLQVAYGWHTDSKITSKAKVIAFTCSMLPTWLGAS